MKKEKRKPRELLLNQEKWEQKQKYNIDQSHKTNWNSLVNIFDCLIYGIALL